MVEVSGLDEEGVAIKSKTTSFAILRTSPAGNVGTTAAEVGVVVEGAVVVGGGSCPAETLECIIIKVSVWQSS